MTPTTIILAFVLLAAVVLFLTRHKAKRPTTPFPGTGGTTPPTRMDPPRPMDPTTPME